MTSALFATASAVEEPEIEEAEVAARVIWPAELLSAAAEVATRCATGIVSAAARGTTWPPPPLAAAAPQPRSAGKHSRRGGGGGGGAEAAAGAGDGARCSAGKEPRHATHLHYSESLNDMLREETVRRVRKSGLRVDSRRPASPAPLLGGSGGTASAPPRPPPHVAAPEPHL